MTSQDWTSAEFDALVADLSRVSALSDEDKSAVEAVRTNPAAVTTPDELEKEAEGDLIKSEAESSDVRQQLQKATLPQKIKLAMFGNSTVRGLLIQDTNKMISLLVLRNPKMQAHEVEAFAKNPNTADYILRGIADNREWMRSYQLKRSIVMNPKSPGDVSLKWLRHLQGDDVKRISKSKNLPNLVITAAKKMASDASKR